MKKNSIIALATLVMACTFTACSHEEDDIFGQSAAERLNSVSNIYSQRLTDSKGGWVMEYYPYDDNEDLLTGTGYLILNRFHDNGSVFTMMKNAASYNTAWTDSTAWEVITDMGPVLTFNTYNVCYGRFSDPDDLDLTPGTYDDESGKGFQGDYEFVMVDVPENGDHIMLKGKKRGLYQRLTRLPEGTDFESYLDDIAAFKAKMFVSNAAWELTMTENGTRYTMNHQDRGCSTVYPEGKDSTNYGWHEPFLVTKYNDAYHLRFKDTIMVEGHQMEQEFAYNPEDDKFHGVIDPNNTIEGADPTSHFVAYMKSSRKWTHTLGNKVEGKASEALNTVNSDFSAHKYTVKSISFSMMADDCRVTISLQSGKNTVEINYLYDMTINDDNSMTISYREPYVTNSNKRSSQILSTITTLTSFLEAINGTYSAKQASGTNFDLRTLEITSNEGNAFVVQAQR